VSILLVIFLQLSLSRPAVPSMRRKHATASVRMHANAWASEDLLPAGLAVTPSSAAQRPCSLSSAGDPPSVLSESTDPAVESEGEQDQEHEHPIPEEDEQQEETVEEV
jgi:hypothetical protein